MVEFLARNMTPLVKESLQNDFPLAGPLELVFLEIFREDSLLQIMGHSGEGSASIGWGLAPPKFLGLLRVYFYTTPSLLKEGGKIRRSGRVIAVKFDRSLKGGQGSGLFPDALIGDPEMILDLGTLGLERRRLHQIRHGSR